MRKLKNRGNAPTCEKISQNCSLTKKSQPFIIRWNHIDPKIQTNMLTKNNVIKTRPAMLGSIFFGSSILKTFRPQHLSSTMFSSSYI